MLSLAKYRERFCAYYKHRSDNQVLGYADDGVGERDSVLLAALPAEILKVLATSVVRSSAMIRTKCACRICWRWKERYLEVTVLLLRCRHYAILPRRRWLQYCCSGARLQ